MVADVGVGDGGGDNVERSVRHNNQLPGGSRMVVGVKWKHGVPR